MKRYESVDAYIAGADSWKEELIQLRGILGGTELEETVKWGLPCYTRKGKNLVGLGAFKSYVGLWFFQGALLSDPQGVLINAQEGRTKAMRQWRFASAEEIDADLIRAYVAEAISVQDQGKEIKPDRSKPVVPPDELATALASDPAAREGFEGLSKGRRREYAEYIASAKRADTTTRRIEKILPMLRDGVGLNDHYR